MPAGPGPSRYAPAFQGISGGASWPASARARASLFQSFRLRWQRLTFSQRPGLPLSSFTNLRSPVQMLITFGRRGSHQTVVRNVEVQVPGHVSSDQSVRSLIPRARLLINTDLSCTTPRPGADQGRKVPVTCPNADLAHQIKARSRESPNLVGYDLLVCPLGDGEQLAQARAAG